MVNLLTTVVLAFSMSADAFAAALGKGAALERPRLSEALRTGFVFGITEAITPVMGWAAGIAASSYITAIDHWIAFALLAAIGRQNDLGERPPSRRAAQAKPAFPEGIGRNRHWYEHRCDGGRRDLSLHQRQHRGNRPRNRVRDLLDGDGRHSDRTSDRRKVWAHCRGDGRNRADRDRGQNPHRTHASQLTPACF